MDSRGVISVQRASNLGKAKPEMPGEGSVQILKHNIMLIGSFLISKRIKLGTSNDFKHDNNLFNLYTSVMIVPGKYASTNFFLSR